MAPQTGPRPWRGRGGRQTVARGRTCAFLYLYTSLRVCAFSSLGSAVRFWSAEPWIQVAGDTCAFFLNWVVCGNEEG